MNIRRAIPDDAPAIARVHIDSWRSAYRSLVSDALPIVHARFRGVELAPLGIGHNFIKWYVPKEEQKLVMTR